MCPDFAVAEAKREDTSFIDQGMAYREFRDDSGRRWTVWDTYPQTAHRSTMDALQGGWLTFEAGGDRRRLFPAPVGWVDEGDDRLRHWLGLAEAARPRLEAYEARTAANALAASREDPAEPVDGPALPRVTEDMRSLIERSRQTLDELNRAIEGQYGPMGDPPDRRTR